MRQWNSLPGEVSESLSLEGLLGQIFRCCTKAHDFMGNTGSRWMVGLGDLGGLFQPC